MKTGLFTGLCAVMMGVVSAQALVVDSVNSGWYRSDGFHNPSNWRITAGVNTTAATGTWEYRNFFVFDLAGGPSSVIGAYLEVWNPANNGFFSADASETYTLFAVSTPVWEMGIGLPDRPDIFTDLGTGIIFGQYEASASDNGTIVKMSLNQDALAAINNAILADGSLVIGGAITSIDGGNYERFFANGYETDDMVRRLVLETRSVPDQGTTIALLGLAMMGLGLIRNRKR